MVVINCGIKVIKIKIEFQIIRIFDKPTQTFSVFFSSPFWLTLWLLSFSTTEPDLEICETC